MTYNAKRIVTGSTENHIITIVEGHLTIESKQKTVNFTPSETEQLLDILLVWRYGLEVIAWDKLEDESFTG